MDTFSPSPADDEFTDLLKASATQVTAFANAPQGGLYASTSNLGKVFLLSATPESEGSYESDVFDAHNFSRWGRAEFRGSGNVELFARSGNVDNPDRNWSPWEKIDLRKRWLSQRSSRALHSVESGAAIGRSCPARRKRHAQLPAQKRGA